MSEQPDGAAGLEAAGVWIADPRRILLAPTTVSISPGSIVVTYGDPGPRHALLALALGGRIALGGGEVILEGHADPATLHRKVALVDVPGVSDPDDVTTLGSVVGEELAMAGRPARKRHVEEWLTQNGLWVRRKDRLEDLPTGVRTLALARLAAQRPGVEYLVLALPERHGVDPQGWLETAVELAGQGFGVLATTSVGVARHIEAQAPFVRTVPFGNAEFHQDEELETGFDTGLDGPAQPPEVELVETSPADPPEVEPVETTLIDPLTDPLPEPDGEEESLP